MRTFFSTAALATILLAFSAVAAPVADADVAIEKREPHGTRTVKRHGDSYHTTTKRRYHTSFATPPSSPNRHRQKSSDDDDDDDSSSKGSRRKGSKDSKGSKGSKGSKDSKGSKGPSEKSSYSSSSLAPDEDSQSMLDAHNKYRAKHGCDDYSWSDELASFAFSHASSCVFEHTGGEFGENLAAGFSSIEASVDGWYDEIKDYDFNNPGFDEETGHFTQVVWKGSSRVGCAWVSCNTRDTPGMYLVCEYENAGNVIGDFPNNVLRS
jgi:uncharacterized protein YkwD